MEEKLKQKYPKAYKEVMANPLSLVWGNMSDELKEETLKGINENLEDKK